MTEAKIAEKERKERTSEYWKRGRGREIARCEERLDVVVTLLDITEG